MRILAISNLRGYPDEGQKIVARGIISEIAKRHEVWHVNAKANLRSAAFWKKMIAYRPEVIHVFLRPNLSTFLFTKALQILTGKAKTIISALQPPMNLSLWEKGARLFRPDLVLSLSPETDRIFRRRGCRTVPFLTCGVDPEKFRPVDSALKISLREKYGVGRNRFVILHVGHITEGRNLRMLAALQGREDQQVVVVHSPAFEADPEVCDLLKAKGCLLLGAYLPRVEEIYQLSDCYLFPTQNPSNCIELPLSVLEAMACNLPVLMTRFGLVPKLFSPGKDFFYFSTREEAQAALATIRQREDPVRTRERIIPYSWEAIARNLEGIYSGLLAGTLSGEPVGMVYGEA